MTTIRCRRPQFHALDLLLFATLLTQQCGVLEIILVSFVVTAGFSYSICKESVRLRAMVFRLGRTQHSGACSRGTGLFDQHGLRQVLGSHSAYCFSSNLDMSCSSRTLRISAACLADSCMDALINHDEKVSASKRAKHADLGLNTTSRIRLEA